MEVDCPSCRLPFTPFGQGRQPRVLPCGDCYCSECIKKFFNSFTVLCKSCGSNIETQQNFPLNKLYYQTQEQFSKYLIKKNYYESPSHSKHYQDEYTRKHIKYDQKCTNPFCLRPRYEIDGSMQLFCSVQCKQEHEELYLD